MCEDKYEEPDPLLRDDEPPCTFICKGLSATRSGTSQPLSPVK
jgi:hypothetical protein